MFDRMRWTGRASGLALVGLLCVGLAACEDQPGLVMACAPEAPADVERAFEALLKQADEALYAAKGNGRNRVELAAAPVAPARS